MEKDTLVIIVRYAIALDLGVHSDSGLTGILLVYLDQFGGRQDILLYWVGGEDLGYNI